MVASNLVNASIGYSCEILNHLWVLKGQDKLVTRKSLHGFFKKTPSYTENSLKFLELHKLITIQNEQIEIDKLTFKELNGSREGALLLIKKKVSNFGPFIEYMSFVYAGKKEEQSAKLVTEIYSLKKEPKHIQKIFADWGKTLKLSPDNFSNSSTGQKNTISESVLNTEIEIRLHLKNQFGDFFKDIDRDVLEDLTEAIKDHAIDSRKAVNDAGRALEDFLRLNYAKNIDTSGCAGIIQIVNLLAGNKMISSKHNGIITGLGSIRSMGDAHGVDKAHNERWTVQKESALLYIQSVILCIKSLLHFQKNQALLY